MSDSTEKKLPADLADELSEKMLKNPDNYAKLKKETKGFFHEMLAGLYKRTRENNPSGTPQTPEQRAQEIDRESAARLAQQVTDSMFAGKTYEPPAFAGEPPAQTSESPAPVPATQPEAQPPKPAASEKETPAQIVAKFIESLKSNDTEFNKKIKNWEIQSLVTPDAFPELIAQIKREPALLVLLTHRGVAFNPSGQLLDSLTIEDRQAIGNINDAQLNEYVTQADFTMNLFTLRRSHQLLLGTIALHDMTRLNNHPQAHELKTSFTSEDIDILKSNFWRIPYRSTYLMGLLTFMDLSKEKVTDVVPFWADIPATTLKETIELVQVEEKPDKAKFGRVLRNFGYTLHASEEGTEKFINDEFIKLSEHYLPLLEKRKEEREKEEELKHKIDDLDSVYANFDEKLRALLDLDLNTSEFGPSLALLDKRPDPDEDIPPVDAYQLIEGSENPGSPQEETRELLKRKLSAINIASEAMRNKLAGASRKFKEVTHRITFPRSALTLPNIEGNTEPAQVVAQRETAALQAEATRLKLEYAAITTALQPEFEGSENAQKYIDMIKVVADEFNEALQHLADAIKEVDTLLVQAGGKDEERQDELRQKNIFDSNKDERIKALFRKISEPTHYSDGYPDRKVLSPDQLFSRKGVGEMEVFNDALRWIAIVTPESTAAKDLIGEQLSRAIREAARTFVQGSENEQQKINNRPEVRILREQKDRVDSAKRQFQTIFKTGYSSYEDRGATTGELAPVLVKTVQEAASAGIFLNSAASFTKPEPLLNVETLQNDISKALNELRASKGNTTLIEISTNGSVKLSLKYFTDEILHIGLVSAILPGGNEIYKTAPDDTFLILTKRSDTGRYLYDVDKRTESTLDSRLIVTRQTATNLRVSDVAAELK